MSRVLQRTALFACAGAVLLAGCGSSSPASLQAEARSTGEGGGNGGVESGDVETAGAGGAGGGTSVDCDEISAELQAALDAAVEDQGLPGAAAAVSLGACRWRGASGVADADAKVPMRPDDLFRVGSITKTFMATLALMLRAEGRLSLDDGVSRYVEGVPDGEQISVRQILNHTSGIYDFTQSDEFWSAALSDPARAWTPRELIEVAASHPPYFEPGQGFAYSNTNYIIAGLILEAASGEPVGELLRARILEPAGLAHTYLDGAEAALPGLVRGYGIDRGKLVDTTSAADPSAAGTAGALVSTTDDLTRFYRKVLDGELLGPAELAEMTTWVDARLGEVTGYGLGLSRCESQLGPQYGHDGGIWGFTSSSYYAVDGDASITVLVNLEVGDARTIVDDLSELLTMRRAERGAVAARPTRAVVQTGASSAGR
ncbi:serine hydrolase domain-containing protein [Sorangium cellulosum]|uniref:serine hydrolase domain-containing protein n=1 Tax=Sorangium TaxID=39643 RepID=UPI000AAF5548|nr:serine hydrolase domain-containing protein [Sorangium cellulosum]